MMQKIFLTAEWRNLVMANYTVDPAILKSYLPAKTELDFWNGNCYVSLVGFMFKQVRIKGIKIPFHTDFPEVNLRFYVRYKEGTAWKRGVVFISEIVPKPAIVFVANTIFKEHYSALPMKYEWKQSEELLSVAYNWKKNKKWNQVKADADSAIIPLQYGSHEEFITEHFWGYSLKSPERTVEYHVQHPRWNIHKVRAYNIDCDFGALYGKAFAELATRTPDAVFLAEGSAVKVFSKKVI